MRKALAWTFVTLLALASMGRAQEPKVMPAHVLLTEAQLIWGDGPPALPKGGTMAVLAGDPGKTGQYTLRAKLPAGYKIAPHWHPTDEHVTVISGTVAFGMGDKAVMAEMKELPAGGFAVMPANMHHYFTAKSAAVIQVHGVGPFAITYINPADDPRQALPAK
jgi:quercetin dioxygenase-like cupin family protein